MDTLFLCFKILPQIVQIAAEKRAVTLIRQGGEESIAHACVCTNIQISLFFFSSSPIFFYHNGLQGFAKDRNVPTLLCFFSVGTVNSVVILFFTAMAARFSQRLAFAE
ncbi:hypothetical protein MMU07_20470 [Aquiflexum sp. LQ15W]|uniref:hypothetical protein n=1 Tax=Cognataquiflexum nitidum TaxID=2922272 RepID=UPI001F13C096|nr:hypothetical protein [Cognataquiflexum nitidum]MCH6201964.1 hypothetical protein [Cognataquiflexum nitidum]